MSTSLAQALEQPARVATLDRRWRRWLLALPALLLLCLCLIALSVAIGVGSVTLTPGQFWQALWAPEQASRLAIVATNSKADARPDGLRSRRGAGHRRRAAPGRSTATRWPTPASPA